MSKKSNYFSHDSNSRTDEKIILLRIKYGAEGYGIYFMILENLREQANYSFAKDYSLLAFDLRVEEDKIKSIIEDFGLFSFTECGSRFFSESFNKRMSYKDEKSNKARESANKRWENDTNAKISNANALPKHTKNDASKVKESKVKEREKEVSPSFDLSNSNLYRKPRVFTKTEVWECFMKKGGTKEMASKFWNKHESTGWYIGGNPIMSIDGLAMNYVNTWIDNESKKQSFKKSEEKNSAPPLKTVDQIG